MSVEALAAVLHHSRAKGTAKLVLMGIANHQGDGGAWPAITTLARYANVHPRNVIKAIRQLEGLGELRTLHQAGGLVAQADETRPNLYQVLVACPGDCDGSAQHKTATSRRHYPITMPLWPVDNDVPDRVAIAPGGGDSARGWVAAAPGDPLTPAPPEPSPEPATNTPSPVPAQPHDEHHGPVDNRVPCPPEAAASIRAALAREDRPA